MYELRVCLNRRNCRIFKGCILLFIFIALIRYFTGYTKTSHTIINNKKPAHPTKTGNETNDAFATHFQAGFHFRNLHKEGGNVQTIKRKLQAPEDWPQFFEPRSHQQFSLEYSYVHKAIRACLPTVDELVMVLSLPGNFLQRQAIRDTWGSGSRTGTWPGNAGAHALPKRLGVIFLMGEEVGTPSRRNMSEDLQKESEEYGDVVQWKGLQDRYFNLTLKVLLGLRWADQFCPKVSHVIKTDDDTFVHVPRLLRVLTSQNATNTIWGPYFYTAPCEREGKYAVSNEAYPFERYPPHVKGNLYVLTGDLVSRMVMLAPYLPYNNMEDVHVTGTLARTLGVRHEAFSRRQFSVTPESPDGCLFKENQDSLGSQMVSPELAFHFWKTFSGLRSCRDKDTLK